MTQPTKEPQTLGACIEQARTAKGLSLAKVADKAKISPAYQRKLESDLVSQPSPNVLHREAGVLDVPYAVLMQLAGYVLPESTPTEIAPGLDYALNSKDLTEDERRAIAAYMALLREQRKQNE